MQAERHGQLGRGGQAAWLFIFITRLVAVAWPPCLVLVREGWSVSRGAQGGFCWPVAGRSLLCGEVEPGRRGQFLRGNGCGSRQMCDGDVMT